MTRSPISPRDRAATEQDITQAQQPPAAAPSKKATEEAAPSGEVTPSKETTPTTARDYGEQIAKFLPAEVLAFYLPAVAAAEAFKTPPSTTTTAVSPSSLIATTEPVITAYSMALWIIFIAGLVATLAYMYSNAYSDLVKEKILSPKLRATAKAGISALAFIVWAFYLGGPFAGVPYQQPIGTLLVLLFTLGSPFFYDRLRFPDNAQLATLKITQKTKSTSDMPGHIDTINIKNNYSENIKLSKAILYWKKRFVEIPTSEYEFNDAVVNANKNLSQPLELEFSAEKNAKNHILKIQTTKGVLKSDPIDAYK